MLTTLPQQKIIEIVGSLARGRSPELTAARTHTAVAEVRAVGRQFGWPDIALLIEASEQLRNAPATSRARATVATAQATAATAAAVEPDPEPTAPGPAEPEPAEPEAVDEPAPPAVEAPAPVVLADLLDGYAVPHLVQVGVAAPAALEAAPVPSVLVVEEAAGRWAAGVRTIEALLDEALIIGVGEFPDKAAVIWAHVRDLTAAVEAYHESQDERERLLAELEEISVRQDVLLARLQEIATAYNTPPTPEPAAAPSPGPDRLWFELPTDVRNRARQWAQDKDLPCPRTGRIPTATLAGYLDAHPEDDPR